jgi:hypothetical protein
MGSLSKLGRHPFLCLPVIPFVSKSVQMKRIQTGPSARRPLSFAKTLANFKIKTIR